jgi:hypothetical protein
MRRPDGSAHASTTPPSLAAAISRPSRLKLGVPTKPS